jgi:hypothetical protein
MPDFMHQFATEVGRKAERFQASFDTAPRHPWEHSLADQLALNWHALPEPQAPEPRRSWAVDGASAARALSNGSSFLIAQSLLIGPDETEDSRVAVEIVRPHEVNSAERAVDQLRQFCEYRVAAENLEKIAGGMLLIDGSLLSDLAHLPHLTRTRIGDYVRLQEDATECFMSIVEGCESRDILLVGISKSMKQSLLADALLANPLPEARLSDAEVLYRFTRGPGYTTPILFGKGGLKTGQKRDDKEEASRYQDRLERLPAIAVFFARLAGGEDALRVDVVASALGLRERLLSFDGRLADHSLLQPLLQILIAQHGGPSVYNAPLYTVDRLVRLRNAAVDGAYIAVLRDKTGVMVMPDRGSGRFIGG